MNKILTKCSSVLTILLTVMTSVWLQAASLLLSIQLIKQCESSIQKRHLRSHPPHISQYDDSPDYEHHVPEYRYSYDVTSFNTGDIKSQHETRDGNSVYGFYSLMEPGGTLREVRYTADGYHGFRATVKRFRHGIQIE